MGFDFGVPAWQVALVFAFAFFYGGFKSAFGLGGSAITPVLAMVMDPKLAVAVVGPLALWTDVAALRNHWGRWDARIVRLGIPATVVGTLIGVLILRGISAALLNKVLAVVTLSYVAVQVIKQRRAGSAGAGQVNGERTVGWMTSNAFAYLCFFGGGLVGTLSHAGGILITFYLLAAGLGKNVYVATLVSLFFVQNVMKVPLYVGMGILSVPGFLLTLAALPPVFAGGWVGNKLNTRLSEKQFHLVLNGLMLTIGILLIFK